MYIISLPLNFFIPYRERIYMTFIIIFVCTLLEHFVLQLQNEWLPVEEGIKGLIFIKEKTFSFYLILYFRSQLKQRSCSSKKYLR